MLQIVGNLGWLIRISIAFGFAAFWGYLAYTWYDAGEFGPGMPTVIGVGLLAAFAGLSGLIGLVRLVTSTARIELPDRTAPPDDNAPSGDFDPDEIMARYLARREEEGSPPDHSGDREPRPPLPSPQRPQFGRKVV